MAEFKKGDKVRFVETPEAMQEHCRAPQFYPLPGTVGTACENMIPRGEVQVQWPYGSVKGPDFVWRVPSELLEPVENAAPDYFIRITATCEEGAQVEVKGPADWIHEALAQTIMNLDRDDPIGALTSVLNHALNIVKEANDGTE